MFGFADDTSASFASWFGSLALKFSTKISRELVWLRDLYNNKVSTTMNSVQLGPVFSSSFQILRVRSNGMALLGLEICFRVAVLINFSGVLLLPVFGKKSSIPDFLTSASWISWAVSSIGWVAGFDQRGTWFESRSLHYKKISLILYIEVYVCIFQNFLELENPNCKKGEWNLGDPRWLIRTPKVMMVCWWIRLHGFQQIYRWK